MAHPSDPADPADPADPSGLSDDSVSSGTEPHKDDESSGPKGVELSLDQLSAEALRGLVEEFITREGTDYGSANLALGAAADPHAEWTLDEKVAQVNRQLESGDARIVFDLELETVSIVPADALALHLRGAGADDVDVDVDSGR